jgi:DNA methylase
MGTQKPVECMRPMLNNSEPGDIVYEPFLGSGTTLIAVESTSRICRAIEIDPLYVDVAVKRWQAFTGKEAVRHGEGKTFAAVEGDRLAAHKQRIALPQVVAPQISAKTKRIAAKRTP